MRLKLLLPRVEPEVFPESVTCPYPGCASPHVQVRQVVPKPLRDTQVAQVVARRYDCRRCGRTFRLYPTGVSLAHTSARLRGVAVLLYLLGLSYGAVSLALEALGCPLSKTAVYNAVQAAGQRVAGLRREAVRLPVGQQVVAALGADLTTVKCQGQWLTVGVAVDALDGVVLSVDVLDNAETATLVAWIQDLAAAVGAEVLVSDDADGFKTAADAAGLAHQVCVRHVQANTDAWLARYRAELASDVDGSLAALGVAPEQALADLAHLARLIRERDPTPEALAALEAIHRRYRDAPSPRQQGATEMSLAYKLRLFSLDRWELYRRLTRYRTWRDAHGRELDGTNNACERAIGWWIKERYRTMRGYKEPDGVRHVSRLTAWAGNQLNRAGADLGLVVT